MSAHHSLRLCSPLKTVFWKVEDTYQAHCNTYKTHTMATCHGGSGQPLDRDIDVTREAHEATDTDIEDMQDFHPVEASHLQDLEHNNPARLTAITTELDDIWQQVQAEEGQPSGSFELHRMKIAETVHISLSHQQTQPLGEVLRHYTNTLCSAQKQTNFTKSLLQDICIFTGHDTTLLEGWLMDIETAADLTTESRKKLVQAKSKGLTCTLITEAITSGKSWDDIKDLL